jgi:pathogenesis-related protein 1
MANFLLLLAALLSTGFRVQASAPLTGAQQAEILRAHNEWRARVGTLPLRWSGDLADTAQSWATTLADRGCRLQHSDKDLGENLYFASALQTGDRRQLLQMTPGHVIETWASEAADYSYATNSCARGKTCGHYTQIVWNDTREVGCGMAICPDLGQIWVCEYRPAGNVVGSRPY